ncbi:MAG: hypothetical protein QGH51_09795 [Planctomycetota bacterium]|jgi:hypothetical protein|nr:hypothetical protein [Planctomycetota bacterium]MDP6942303.1 hypothetical protein [Planctomycetota bacterium]
MDILNKTNRPIKVDLPGGKVLRLGPSKTGQITPKAASYPPVQKLIEEGVLEILDGGGSDPSSGSPGSANDAGAGPSAGFSSGGGIRRTGNR